MLSTTHQTTPQTSTQLWILSVQHDDNHEHVQLFDEVVFAWQPWWSTTQGNCLPRTNASTSITKSTSFENQPLNINMNLVPIKSEIEQIQLLNKLEQFHHIKQRPNQLISILHLELFENWATPMIIWQPTRYIISQINTWSRWKITSSTP
jgi:hypothetical protein